MECTTDIMDEIEKLKEEIKKLNKNIDALWNKHKETVIVLKDTRVHLVNQLEMLSKHDAMIYKMPELFKDVLGKNFDEIKKSQVVLEETIDKMLGYEKTKDMRTLKEKLNEEFGEKDKMYQ